MSRNPDKIFAGPGDGPANGRSQVVTTIRPSQHERKAVAKAKLAK
jgi:hypothetical protein